MTDDRSDETQSARGEYWDGHDAYYAARKLLGAQLLAADPAEQLEWLTREPMNLRNRVGLTVHWGLSMNLVHRDPASSIAYAWLKFEDADPDALAKWAEGMDIDDPEELRLAYEEHGEPVFPTHAALRAFQDLTYALTTGYGQSVALQALLATKSEEDGSLISIPDADVVGIAAYLLPAVGLIAEERVSEDICVVPKTRYVPRTVWEAFIPLALHVAQSLDGIKQPLWILNLVHCFERPLHGGGRSQRVSEESEPDGVFHQLVRETNPELAAAAAVDSVLLAIADSPDLPAVFLRRQKAHIKLAKALIRTIRIETTETDDDDFLRQPEFQFEPDRARRGRSVKPWKAASMFAKCFGVDIPSRERDAKRRK